MTLSLANSKEASLITVRVPMALRKYGGTKRIVAPDGSEGSFPRRQPDSALIKAIARAFRWRKLLDEGVHATLSDLATAEKINPSYVSRVLRLTLLAPELVDAILDGRQLRALTLAKAMLPFPTEWKEQMIRFTDR